MTEFTLQIELPAVDYRLLVQRALSLQWALKGLRHWDQIGLQVAGNLCSGAGRQMKENRRARYDSPLELWSLAKLETILLLASNHPRHARTRVRLQTHPPSSTHSLVTSLAFWMSGLVSVPISAVTPLVAVLVYGLADRHSNLLASLNPDVADDPKVHQDSRL